MHLTKFFMAIFTFAERLPTSATLHHVEYEDDDDLLYETFLKPFISKLRGTVLEKIVISIGVFSCKSILIELAKIMAYQNNDVLNWIKTSIVLSYFL